MPRAPQLFERTPAPTIPIAITIAIAIVIVIDKIRQNMRQP